jgi:hypothetical protein
MEAPFDFVDIEDVSIIVKAKGQHWHVIPANGADKEEAKEFRKSVAIMLIGSTESGNAIASKSAEQIREELMNKTNG